MSDQPSDDAVRMGAEGFKGVRLRSGGRPVTTDTDREASRAVLAAAYPIIRADVIAEVVAFLRDSEKVLIPSDGLRLAADLIGRGLGFGGEQGE